MSDPRVRATSDTYAASKAPPTGGALELTETDLAAVANYVREMTDTVIPEIIKVVEERRKMATLSRQWPLKVGG
jgi:hypothetical protein